MKRVALFGLPTAGKSTLSYRLATMLRIPQVNVGQCLRNTALHRSEIKRKLDTGEFVENSVVIRAVQDALAHTLEYVLDGFPRSYDQLLAFDAWPVSRSCQFILLDLEPSRVRSRFLIRMNCPRCRCADYGDGPSRRCALCNGPLLLRDDATDEVLAAKLRAFSEDEGPVLAHLEQHQRLLRVPITGEAAIDFYTILDILEISAPDGNNRLQGYTMVLR